MILIFDYFETLLHNKSMDFNRALLGLWERYYKDKCSFEDISAYGAELFRHLSELHTQGLEYAFVKDELPMYAKKYGGEVINMSPEEEADFLMKCNDMEIMPHIPQALDTFTQMDIPMYILSNSGFRSEALSIVLKRFGIRKYFKQIWSSANFGQIKPCKDFFELAIQSALSDYPDQKRKDIVFIGDTYESDVVGAVGAGIDVIWLNYKKENNYDNLPVHCIYHTRELTGIIPQIK